MLGQSRFTGPVRVELEFRRSSKRRADLDNLVKSVLDAANGFLWDDDAQVVEAQALVLDGSSEPGTWLRVAEVLR